MSLNSSTHHGEVRANTLLAGWLTTLADQEWVLVQQKEEGVSPAAGTG